jgi:outer membrane immunogenic protein
MGLRTAIAVSVVMCTTQVAISADVLVPPPLFYDWTGVYLGANAGYGTGSISDTANGATTTTSISGAIAGGQIGANLQLQRLLVGVEVDADWSSQNGSSDTSLAASMPWLSTARIRVGTAYDRIALYATGGAAYLRFTSTATSGVASTSTRTTWVVGFGQESAINRNVILRFEALYLQLPNGETPAGSTVASTQRAYDIIARIGLSYKFDWAGNW